MPLFLSDEEHTRCSGDPSLISQKADAFIKELYNQLQTHKAQSIDKDAEIERLSLEVAELQKSKSQLLQEIKHKDIVLNKKNSRIKDYQQQLDPDVLLLVQNTVQFSGLPDEDPHYHIKCFLQICDVFTINKDNNLAYRHRLFPFTLRDKAKMWFRCLPIGSITTWEDMLEEFFLEYFPPSKAAKLRNEVISFLQMDGESLDESWYRFKELLRRCPNHGISLWSQVQTFYNGLDVETMRDIQGVLTSETPEDAFDLIERMVKYNVRWRVGRNRRSTRGVHEVDEETYYYARLDSLNYQIDHLRVNGFRVRCEVCGGPHSSKDCRDGNMSSSSGWRNDLN